VSGTVWYASRSHDGAESLEATARRSSARSERGSRKFEVLAADLLLLELGEERLGGELAGWRSTTRWSSASFWVVTVPMAGDLDGAEFAEVGVFAEELAEERGYPVRLVNTSQS